MGRKLIIYFILILILSQVPKISSAQEIPFTPRDNIIFITLNQLQEREEAIRGSMREAQMKLIESEPVREKEKGFSFRDISSHAHPYLTLSTTFDDNVDGTPEKKSSLINTIKPGLRMNFAGRNKSLNLNTYLDNTYYNNRSRSNSQGATIDILTNFSLGRYNLSLSDVVYSNRISSKELGMEIDGIQYYWKNSFATTLGRYFNRIGFNLGYGKTYCDYEPDFSLSNDNTSETFSFNQYLRVATKTQVLLEYSHGRTKYIYLPSSDSKYDDYNLTMSGVLSSKITGSAKMGYKLGDPKEGDDYRTTTFTGSFGYRISDRSDLALTLKRAIYEPATHSSYSIDDDFQLSGSHRLAFNPKFKLSFSYEADYCDYPKRADFTEEQNTYTQTLGLSYAFRQWLDFSLNYTRNRTADDYSKNTVVFTTEARF